MTERFVGLISAKELLNYPQENLRILDVRHDHRLSSKKCDYFDGHIPGAVFVELRDSLAGKRNGTNGNNPLPTISQMHGNVRDWGINHDTTVVVYADAGAPSIGRAWWILSWSGVKNILLLDGGIQSWVAAGGSLESGEVAVAKGNFQASADHRAVISAHQAAELGSIRSLIDARGAEYFNHEIGRVETGHIPGAVSFPYQKLFHSDGTFVSPEKFRSLLSDLPLETKKQGLGVYCGGGVAAALLSFALEGIGVSSDLYVGSWSEWVGLSRNSSSSETSP